MGDAPAEQPVPERGAEVYNNEVIIDKVKLDSNSPLKTWVAACESLGVTGRGKAECLKRLWDHLRTQELIAAPLAQHQLRRDLARPVYFQPTPADLAHQPFAPRCELCIANKSQQNGHPARQDEPAGAHTCVSLDFGFASRTEHEQKVCNFFIHDHHSCVVPTPRTGGRHLQCLCSEFSWFLVWLGQSTIALRCDRHFLCLKL